MPGYILHMTTAQILFNKYNLPVDRGTFEVGNLIPDSVSDKTFSHFRHPSRQKKLMVYPDMDLFLNKYKHLLSDSSCLGYYFHLFIDRIYAKDYVPQIVSFHNANGLEVSNRADITHAFIKRTQELVPIKTFFSDEYYYGDFTKMNTYIINRFKLSTELLCNVVNPGIEEVNYKDIQKIQTHLQEYLDISDDTLNELKVFDIEDLLKFLEQTTDEFAKNLLSHI